MGDVFIGTNPDVSVSLRLFIELSARKQIKSQHVWQILWHVLLLWTSRLTVMFTEPATFTAVQTYVPASPGTALSMYKLPSLLRNILPFSWTCAGEKQLLLHRNIENIGEIKKLNTSRSYRFSILGPASFWKRYAIQQHAGNAEGLTHASDDDWGTLGQERGLCRKRKCWDINTEQEQESLRIWRLESIWNCCHCF